jgi:hypothetical protein
MTTRDVGLKRPDFNDSYNYYSSDELDESGYASDSGNLHSRATSLSIPENFTPLTTRIAKWIQQAGSEIKTFFARCQLRSVVDDFIREADTERKSKSCDLIPFSIKTLDANIGKFRGESETKSFQLFQKVFADKLKSCSDEELQNVIETLYGGLKKDTRLLNLGNYVSHLLNVAVMVSSERLAKIIFVNLKKGIAVSEKEIFDACEKVNVNFRVYFAESMTAKFSNLLGAASASEGAQVFRSVPKRKNMDAEEKSRFSIERNLRKRALIESNERFIADLRNIDMEIAEISKSVVKSTVDFYGDVDGGIQVNKEELNKKIASQKQQLAVLNQEKLRLITMKNFVESELVKIMVNEQVSDVLVWLSEIPPHSAKCDNNFYL